MAEFRIDVLDSTVDPPQVLFETPTRTTLLGSAEALARALYERRYAEGHGKDLVRVRYEDKTVFIYGYLNHAEERAQRGSQSPLPERPAVFGAQPQATGPAGMGASRRHVAETGKTAMSE